MWQPIDPRQALKNEQTKSALTNQLDSFYVKVGHKEKIIFLDDFKATTKDANGNIIPAVPFYHYAAECDINERWGQYATSHLVYGNQSCPLIKNEFKVESYWVFTILHAVTNQNGEEVWKKKLLRCKKGAYQNIDTNLSENEFINGNLKNVLCTLSRSDKQGAAKTGDIFTVKRQMEPEEMASLPLWDGHDLKPVDYFEALKPIEISAMEQMINLGQLQLTSRQRKSKQGGGQSSTPQWLQNNNNQQQSQQNNWNSGNQQPAFDPSNMDEPPF